MCDAAGNCVVVCSIENLDPMGVHTGDSWTVAPQQTLPDAEYQRLREAAFACARAVGRRDRRRERPVRVRAGDARAARDRDEPARVALVGARVEGDGLPDREARRAARRRLHARRAAERHHAARRRRRSSPRSTTSRSRRRASTSRSSRSADARLGSEMRAVGEALGLGRTFPEAFLKALEGRETRHGRRDLRGAASPSRALGPRCSRRRGRSSTSGHPSRRRRAPSASAIGACRGSCRPPIARACSASTRRGARARGRARPARRRLVRRRVRGRTPYYYLSYEPGDRGCRRAARAVVVLGCGPEPDRPGDRVRLLLRPRGAGVPAARLRGRAAQLEPGDGLDRLRHLRPALPRAADARARARRVRARAAARRRRLARRPDAARGSRRGLADAGVPLLGDPLAAIDAAEDRGALRAAARRARARAPRVGRRRRRARGARGRRASRLSRARAAALRARRPRACASRASAERARRRRRRASSTVSRGRDRARRRRALRRRAALGRGDPRARRAGGSPLRRLGVRRSRRRR